MNILRILLVLLISTTALVAQDCIPKAPNPPRLVNDFASIISDDVEEKLERALVSFNDSSSTQIAIVTVTDLCGSDAASFTFKLGENWGVGNANFNNGIVVLVKPKYASSKGQAYIATGYGLEGVLPDAIGKRIVENEMIPAFKENNYDGGIINAAITIMEITGGEYSAENYNGSKKKSKSMPVFPFLFIIFFIIIMVAGTVGRARRYARTNNTGLWAALWLMGSMNSRHRGHYNNFRSGGGGFGGFGGGGGFGGFGGGSFGGGGAGGSW